VRSCFLAIILFLLSTPVGRCGTVSLELLVSVTSRMVNAVDQSTYPYTPDPSFVPFQMPVRIVFGNEPLFTDLNQDGASINFGPALTLYSPLTNSLRYGPDNPAGYPTVQSFDYTAYYGPWDKGSFLDFGQSSSRNLSSTDLIDYNWAIVSPTMDPRYPPLADPLSYTSADLMAFLERLMQDRTPINYAEISYEMLNTTSSLAYFGTYYPYADWYSGTATIESIETETPEPRMLVLTGLILIVLMAKRTAFTDDRS